MSFSSLEKKSTAIVSLILALRLLGLFMLLPIFSIYAIEYTGSNAFLAGVAIGTYSLAQAIMQIPLAYLSDRIGRKKVVILGLLVFTIGSLICYIANDINLLILGRIVQGRGAISSVGVATLAENTDEKNRASAFTIVGLTVGIAFVVGFLMGPFLSSMFSFRILFLLLFFFGILALITTLMFYPKNKASTGVLTKKINFKPSKAVIGIYSSSFMLSFILSMFLFSYPLMWQELGTSETQLSFVYLIVFLPSALLIYPSIRFLEKISKIDISIKAAWVFLLISFGSFLFIFKGGLSLYVLGIFFFMGSSVFHSLLPSLLSLYISDNNMRATETGPYYLMSFFGHAVGSILAGYIYSGSKYFDFTNHTILIFICLLILACWAYIGIPKHDITKR